MGIEYINKNIIHGNLILNSGTYEYKIMEFYFMKDVFLQQKKIIISHLNFLLE